MSEAQRLEQQRREREAAERAETQRQADIAATAALVAERDREMESLKDADIITQAKAMRKWANL